MTTPKKTITIYGAFCVTGSHSNFVCPKKRGLIPIHGVCCGSGKRSLMTISIYIIGFIRN